MHLPAEWRLGRSLISAVSLGLCRPRVVRILDLLLHDNTKCLAKAKDGAVSASDARVAGAAPAADGSPVVGIIVA